MAEVATPRPRRVIPYPLVPILRADPAMVRRDRLTVGLSMQFDGFTLQDITRVVSVRRQTLVDLRRTVGLEPLPKGWATFDRWHPERGSLRRSLETIARALASCAVADLPTLAHRLHVGHATAFGVRRAIDYSLSATQNPRVANVYRCPDCDQLTPQHPCAHCGAAWLSDVAA